MKPAKKRLCALLFYSEISSLRKSYIVGYVAPKTPYACMMQPNAGLRNWSSTLHVVRKHENTFFFFKKQNKNKTN